MPKTVQQLLTVPDPAWPIVQAWATSATNHVDLLAPTDAARDEALLAMQVTAHSVLGAIVHETGGLLIDRGWLRILGSGHPSLPRRIDLWNNQCTAAARVEKLGYLLVADDVVGGFFALDGGAFESPNGKVWYFAPDRLRWEPLDRGYADFVNFCLSGDLHQFYETFRWPDWQQEIATICGDQSLSLWPPPWTAEGKDLASVRRQPAPAAETFGLNVLHFPSQLDGDLK